MPMQMMAGGDFFGAAVGSAMFPDFLCIVVLRLVVVVVSRM